MKNILIAVSLGVMLSGGVMVSAAVHKQKATLAEQVYRQAYWAVDKAAKTKYVKNPAPASEQLEEDIRTELLTAQTDAAGFASWVLSSVSAPHLWAVSSMEKDKEVPQASTFARFFSVLKADKPTRGWVSVESASDLHPGDFIAWSDEKVKGKKGTEGHVMIVAGPPTKPKEVEIEGKKVTYISVAVVDSSPVSHFQPEKLPPLTKQAVRDGIGIGVVRLVLNDEGKAVGQWQGTFSNVTKEKIEGPTTVPMIGLGRMQPTDETVPLPKVGGQWEEFADPNNARFHPYY